MNSSEISLPKNLNREIKEQRFTLLGKLFVWSVVLEPLLYFTFIPGTPIGRVSRVLQLLVLIPLILKFFTNPASTRPANFFTPLYRPYSYYMLFAVISGCFGLFTGAYHLNAVSISSTNLIIRVAFEYFIAFYYFAYFAVLPRYLMFSTTGINYFFKIFTRMFYLSLFIGIVDLAMHPLFGFPLIGRHMDEYRDIGFRFHGLAGEPRDTFVYMILGICMFMLRDIWRGEKRLSKSTIFLYLVFALLAKSASGLLGLIFGGILILFFYMPRVSIWRAMLSVFGLSFITTVVFVAGKNSYHVMAYVNNLTSLYPALEHGAELPPVFKVTNNNIYPIWQRWLEIRDFNFLPSLLGTGFGSPSIINNNFIHPLAYERINPNAHIVRSLYANGIIGTYLLVMAFTVPIKKMIVSKPVKLKLTLFMLILVGCFLGHRSSVPFIFLGATLAVLELKMLQQESLRKHIK